MYKITYQSTEAISQKTDTVKDLIATMEYKYDTNLYYDDRLNPVLSAQLKQEFQVNPQLSMRTSLGFFSS